MSSVNQGDRFTEVTSGSKKRKAISSPTLPSQPKPGSSEPLLGTPARPKQGLKNTIPVILSGVDEKFKLEATHGRAETVPPKSKNHTNQGITKR